MLSRILIILILNDTATTAIYTLSLHDALPIFTVPTQHPHVPVDASCNAPPAGGQPGTEARCNLRDRKSTRLNSSHITISYAVFCLKKKKISVSNPAPATNCLSYSRAVFIRDVS